MTASPPSVLEQTSPSTSTMITVRLASAFDTKIRRGDRTATRRCRQVPSRSSDANTSPAISEVSSGSAHEPENPRITSGPAHPVACIQRPKRVSTGSDACWLITATNSAGASQHATITRRTRHCESNLTDSKR